MHTTGIKRQRNIYLLSASEVAGLLAVVVTLLLQGASAQPPPRQPENELIQPRCAPL